MKSKRKKWIKCARRMAQIGYSRGEFRAFALILSDLGLTNKAVIAEMNTTFCRTQERMHRLAFGTDDKLRSDHFDQKEVRSHGDGGQT